MIIKYFKITVIAVLFTLCFSISTNAQIISPPCGDADANGTVDVSDIIYIVDYIFNEGPHMPYYLSIDFDSDNVVDIGDLVRFIDYILDNEQIEKCSFVKNSPSPCLGMAKAEEHAPFSQSGCQDNPVDSTEQMTLEWIGNQIKINHLKAYEQCCLEYKVEYNVVYDYDLREIYVIARESDTGIQCDCICYFNLESYSPELFISGEMDCIVTLFGIDNDPVATDTIKVSESGSLFCELEGNDLTITHKNGYFNCCPNFLTNINLLGQKIVVNWEDTLGECMCMCYYNLQTTLKDLSNGTYFVILLGGDLAADTLGVDTVYINGNIVGKMSPAFRED